MPVDGIPEMAHARCASSFADEGGFNLVEVMVCLAIVGVLVSIAMPTYLGAVERADDAAARASLHVAQVAGRAVAADAGGYTASILSRLEEAEPSIEWADADDPSRGPSVVSHAIIGQELVLAAYSPTGTCWFLRDHPDRGVERASTLGVDRADCTAMHGVGLSFGPTW
jgi:type IV pilus assembly protein PilA